MRIVVAPDSFKESMTASEAARAIAVGLKRVWRDADCDLIPMADGGEGTADAAAAGLDGTQWINASVLDPLGRPVEARFVLAGDLAVIDLAQSSGLGLVPANLRSPLDASTFGTGQLIARALDLGAQRIVLGLGGSATNDGGAGMLQALGALLRDSSGRDVPPGARGLFELAGVDLAPVRARLGEASVVLACDVDSPLLGPRGAAAIFGPQKGASPREVDIIESSLTHFADLIEEAVGNEGTGPLTPPRPGDGIRTAIRDQPGAGAAGGAGFAAIAVLGAQVRSGVEVVGEIVNLSRRMVGADLVVTGEGSMDSQTLQGKTPFGVARHAAAHNIPVIALTGRLGPGWRELYLAGFAAIEPIVSAPCTLAQALAGGESNLRDAAERIARLISVHSPGLGSQF